ncbi:MAG: RsmG family class I SAM-dependent methyltransferase [Coraliomargaritaceae bacterium]
MKLADYQQLFPNIPEDAWPVLERWAELLREWNTKINLISRKDIDALEERHLLHCLAITNVLILNKGARILDVGTGGGLPWFANGDLLSTREIHIDRFYSEKSRSGANNS